MRNIKVTFLLGGMTALGAVLVFFNGWMFPIEEGWKILLQCTSCHAEASELVQGIMMLVVALITVYVGIELNVHKERLILVLCTAGLMISGSLVLALYHLFWNPFPTVLALGVGYFMVLCFLQTKLGARQPGLQRLFGQRLSRSVFKKIVGSDVSLKFLGELKNGSILVCTLNNHAELMESLSPEAYVAMTNLYLQVASDFLVDVGGYLEECSGEGIRVVFGVPLTLEGTINHGAKATRAALDLAKRLDELNRECDARWQQRLDFRIGIHSGEIIAAFYGGNRLGQYSVAGPAVEFARYLCAACMNYGCRILVGPTTYKMAEATAEFRPIDLLQRQGTRRRVELYEVLAFKNSLSMERERSRDLFWQGVIFFRSKEWDKAVAAFTSARIFGISDIVLDLYLERVDRARRGDYQLTPEQSILTESLSSFAE